MDKKGEEDRAKRAKAEKDAFLRFFAESYARIVTCQSEMKYFAPGWKLKQWIKNGTLRPNPVRRTRDLGGYTMYLLIHLLL